MNQNPFLNQSEDIKTSYLIILTAISSADKQSSPQEQAFVEQMSTLAGLSDASKAQIQEAMANPQNLNLKDHLAKFSSSDLKYALAADLLNLAYKDGNLDSNESSQISQINSVIGVNEEQFKALQQYVTAANKEAEQTNGNAFIDENGQPKTQNNFLEKTGLGNMFKQLGIPVDHFTTGATIGTALTAGAFFLLKSYVNSNTQGDNSLGKNIGGLISSFLGGNQTQQNTDGQTQQQNNGLGNMISNFFSSEAGSQTINGLLNTVVNSTSQGKGLGNLMDIFSGNQNANNGNNQQQNNGLMNILGNLLNNK